MSGSKEKIARLLLLIPSFKGTGPILGAVAFAKYVDKEKYDVVIGSLDGLNDNTVTVIEELKRLNIKFKSFKIPGWDGLLKMKVVHDYIKEEHIDIVQSYTIRPDIVNAFTGTNCISISSVRGMIREDYRSQFGSAIASVCSSIHFKALNRMDRIIAISNAMKKYLRMEGIREERLTLIPNFVDISRLHCASKDLPSRHRTQRSSVNIACIGSLIPRKRTDLVLKAVAELLKEQSGLRLTLHLFGDGPLRKKLKDLSKSLAIIDHVRFHGHINDIASALKGLDIIVTASESEGIPRSLMEAMSMGKLCIGPRIGGIDELIVDSVTGYLFDPDSYYDLAKKLAHVINENSFLDSKAMKKHIEENFDAKKGSEKTLLFYEQLLAER